ncbi:MAG: HAMP domain-containing protein [Actinobacteria bacterium]|nr:HAMP domain-containing protein [Actinomycetota bacterium]
MSTEQKQSKKAKGRSVILLQITALVLIVVIIMGGLSLLTFARSQDRLIEKSKQKLIKTEAAMLQSAHEFLSGIFLQISELKAAGVPMDVRIKEFLNAIKNKEISSTQIASNTNLNQMVKDNLLGVTGAIFILPATPPLTTKPTIVMASSDDLIYRDIPESILELVDKGEDTYLVMDKGIPELGYEGAHLVSTYEFPINADDPSQASMWFVDFKPLEEEFADVDAFYAKEKRSTFIRVGAVIGGSLIVLVIITFFVLSYMIRNRITKPIDELSSVAEKVIEGDLDVEVPIRPGEEFWNLKKAFNDMIKSIRDVISRATGEQ